MTTRTAQAPHGADREPSDEESEIAEHQADAEHRSGEDRAVAEHFEEMAELGVEQQGEGKIE